MDMQQVEAFLAVADELHFGRAAERLVLSRPRVSKLIASLEREVGGALFSRTSRRVRLTPLGTRFRQQLRPGYNQMQAALADARAAATQASGVLRIGFTVTTGGQALTRLVTAFASAHPDCQVSLTEVGIGDPYAPLRRDEIDVLVNWLAVDEPDLTAGPVIDRCDRALAVAAGHPLAASRQVTAEDLGDLEMARIPPSLPAALSDALLPPRPPSGRPTRRTVARAPPRRRRPPPSSHPAAHGGGPRRPGEGPDPAAPPRRPARRSPPAAHPPGQATPPHPPGSGPAPHPRAGRQRPHRPPDRRLAAACAPCRHHPHPHHRPAAAATRADLVHRPRERPHPRARPDNCPAAIAVTRAAWLPTAPQGCRSGSECALVFGAEAGLDLGADRPTQRVA